MRIWCVILLVLALFSGLAQAEGLAVVDVERIFRESVPGKAGEAHLEQARVILQKGMDELSALYKGKENTAEAESALREGHAALERQFAADRLAVRQVLMMTLEKAAKAWFATNAKRLKISALAPSNAFFAYIPALDVTDAVMRNMDKETPVFHALPTVTIRPNPQTSPGANAPAAPAQAPAQSGTP